MLGSEIMNPDLKDKQVRRCATCGRFHGIQDTSPRCRHCGGPVLTMGPISWTDEDEAKAIEDLGEVEEDGDRFQDVVCDLWDKIDDWRIGYRELEKKRAGQEDLIKELQAEIILHKNAAKMLQKELDNKSLVAKVGKALSIK